MSIELFEKLADIVDRICNKTIDKFKSGDISYNEYIFNMNMLYIRVVKYITHDRGNEYDIVAFMNLINYYIGIGGGR